MSVSLKSDGRDEINSKMMMAMEWLRDHSDNFDSPRRISLAIIGLIAGGDPVKAHHIQRLVTKLRNLQFSTNNSKDGSWSGEISDTAKSLIALNRAILTPQKDSGKIEYLNRGLRFLEKCFDKKLGNWMDLLPETIVACQAILELDDFEKQKENLEKSLDWLCTRKCENKGVFISTKYTSEIIKLLLLAESKLDTDKYRDSINYGIKHLIDSESSDNWSEDPWAKSGSLIAIMKHDNMSKVKMPMVKQRINEIMGNQTRKHAWDDSVTKTVSCILMYSEFLGYKQINENKINYWENFRPASARFSWEKYPQPRNQEIKAIGKLDKVQLDLAPTTLEEFKAELSLDTFKDTVNRKLLLVSNAADSVRRRSISNLTNEDSQIPDDNYVIKTLKEAGKDLYIQLLQDGENHKRYEIELAQNKIDHLTIFHDNTMSVIPWELIYDGNDFCCLKYSIGRMSKGVRSQNNPSIQEGKLKVLLVGDPSGDLIEANNEIKLIEKYFTNETTDLTVCTNETFDPRDGNFRSKFLALLAANKFDIIHYAGHADFDSDTKKSYLYFQKPSPTANDKVSALDVQNYIRGSQNIPKIVFFNACSSAARGNTEDSNQIKFDNQFANLASDFVKAFSILDIPAYVGAIWPIHDAEAAEFAKLFYDSIKHGCTVGEAIRLARIESFLNHPDHLTWASFILYGDPARKIEGLKVNEND